MSVKEKKGLKRKKKKRHILVTILLILLVLALIGGGFMYSIYAANRMDISDYEYTAKDKTYVYSSDNQIIAELYIENRTNVTLDQIPLQMQQALVAVEDSRFYSHSGIDPIGIVRAFLSNLVNSGISSGASTITQQLARTLFLPDIASEQTFQDSLLRKLKEISISLQLEDKYTKDQILEMFFNETYFGSNAYGIEEAAKTYFNKSVSEIDLAEAAMLAGLPQAPSAYAPNSNFEAAKERQLEVLNRMVDENYITQEEADAAYAEELVIRDPETISYDDQIVDGYEAYVNMVLQEYAESQAASVMQQRGISEDDAISYIRETIASGGYNIYTTINTTMQADAIDSLQVGLEDYGLTDNETGAVVTVDLDGAVMAYYGGNTQIDMADTPRQPGSNIKPLYYAAAMDMGLIGPSTIISDTATTFYGTYTPKNYDGSFHGNVTVRTALVNSYNIPAVKVFDKVGADSAISFMEQMGISTFEDSDYNLATALGGMTYGIKPYEMAAAFNCLNNNGVYNEPYFTKSIETVSGEVIYSKDTADLVTRKVMADTTAATMMDILEDVVSYGTGTAAAQIYTTAGKTGTTNDNKDLWFTGITGNLTTAVWIGSPENTVLTGGSYIAAGIYGNYLGMVIDQDLLTTTEMTRTTEDGSVTNVSSLGSSGTTTTEETEEEKTDETTTQDQPTTDTDTDTDTGEEDVVTPEEPEVPTDPGETVDPVDPTTPEEPTTPDDTTDTETDSPITETNDAA